MADSRYWAGVWRLADPKVSLASFAGMFMAACFAARDSGLDPPWLLLTVLGVFCVEIAKNASGEVVDFHSGTDLAIEAKDRSPFSGGKRVLVDGLLSPTQTWKIAALCFGLAVAIGLCIVVFREPGVLVIGAIGMWLAWSYHGGILRLSYRGFGELAVMLAYGPLVVSGTYLVQTGYLSAALLHLSLVLGLLVAAFLWINQFPDYRADRAAGKRNLVVRLGRQRAALAFAVLVFTPYLWLVFTAAYYPETRGALWGLVGLAPGAFAVTRVLAAPEHTAGIVPAQAACLASFVLFAFGAGLGYAAG